jgi:hypothetical protein
MVATKRSIPLTRVIQENLSIVMTFAYSQQPLAEMFEGRFRGRWQYLHNALFGISAEHAEKAFLELALFLRILDDEQNLSGYFASTKDVPNCGKLIMKNGSEQLLPFREVANKVIHSSQLEWKLEKGADPVLICHTQDEEKWIRAEVDVVALATVCGGLMG